MSKHLIFFDKDCLLCQKAVTHLLRQDTNQQFIFAPLGGSTAENILCGPQQYLQEVNSLILVENYQCTSRIFWIRSKAILRIYGHLGSTWSYCLSWLPSWIGDSLYQKIALHRHCFKLPSEKALGPKERFLP